MSAAGSRQKRIQNAHLLNVSSALEFVFNTEIASVLEFQPKPGQ